MKHLIILLVLASVVSTAHASDWRQSAEVADQITGADDSGDRWSDVFSTLENQRLIEKIKQIQREEDVSDDGN